jgi:molybdopterin-guanine dinucleotide biosynthesis protein A
MTAGAGAAAGTVAKGPAGAVLAGGRALRFGGRAKGLELVGGARIVDRAVAALREVATEILLVGASPAVAATLPRLRWVPDEAPGAGPLGGILSALRAARRDTVIVAWDMPFLGVADLRPLLEQADDADAVVWEHDGHLEPLCGLYRASAVEPLARAFSDGERSPREALRRLRVHVVSRARSGLPSPFASVNTTEQLADARARHTPIMNRGTTR